MCDMPHPFYYPIPGSPSAQEALPTPTAVTGPPNLHLQRLFSPHCYLLRTSGQFELKAFKNRRDSDRTLYTTREWLRHAHAELLARDSFSPFGANSPPIKYTSLSRKQQT